MKKTSISVFLFIILSIGLLTACGTMKGINTDVQPELSQIQAICNLSTLECYYHTVGSIKKNKTDDKQVIDFLKKDRTVWIEYTGIAKIGIDMSKVKMEVNGDSIQITIPDAELLSIAVDEGSFNEDSFYISEDDWLVKNTVTADLQSQAIDNGQSEIMVNVLSNRSIMNNARIRAQRLIKKYIDEIGEVAGIKYNITWKYEDGTISSNIPETEEVETTGE